MLHIKSYEKQMSLSLKRRIRFFGTSIVIFALLAGGAYFALRHMQSVNVAATSGRPVNGVADTGKDYLINAFKPGGETGVFRDDVHVSSTSFLEAYRMAIEIGDGKYWTMQLRGVSGRDVKSLSKSDIRVPSKMVNWRDASWTFSSGAWSSSSQPYIGADLSGDKTFRQAQQIGNYVEWAVTDADLATWQIYAGPNQSIFSVAVDGDNAAANKLPTAQEFVDNGTLDLTALVANGGTLEPNDRVIDGFSATYVSANVDIADNLAGTHTIRLTLTPYKNPSSTTPDPRMAVACGYITSDAYSNLSDADVSLRKIADLNTMHSIYEYIGQFKPTGASNFVRMGNTMYNGDIQTGLTVKVDGTPVSLANGQMVVGEVEILRSSTLRHPEVDNSNTPIANITVSYKMLPNVGLDVSYDLEHLTDGQVNAFYSLMYPVNGNFNKGSALCATQDFTMTNTNAVTSFSGGCKGDTAWMWDSNSGSAVLFEAKDADGTVNNWQNSGGDGPVIRDFANNLTVEDRGNDDGASFSKILLMRVAETDMGDFTESYSQGDIWSAHGVYRAQVFDDVDAMLARIDRAPGVPATGWFGGLSGDAVAVDAMVFLGVVGVIGVVGIGCGITLKRI